MNLIASLASALPNTLQMGVDSANRALDRRSHYNQWKARENAFTSQGLPSFMAYQGGGNYSDFYRPQSYTQGSGRNFYRTGMPNSPYTGPSAGGWYNAETINNASRGTQTTASVAPPTLTNSSTGSRFPPLYSSFVPGFQDSLGNTLAAGQNDRVGLGAGRY